jgi:hypothetical protein
VAVFVLNAAGEIYARRSSDEDAPSAHLDVCVSAAARPGESVDDAARRSVETELLLPGACPVLVGAVEVGGPEPPARTWIYRLETAGPPAPAPATGWGDYLPLDSAAALLGSGYLTPAVECCFRAFLASTGESPAPFPGWEPGALADALAFTCLHCGESNTVPVDIAGGAEQDLIEDCQTCCAPNRLRIVFDPKTLAPSVEVSEP